MSSRKDDRIFHHHTDSGGGGSGGIEHGTCGGSDWEIWSRVIFKVKHETVMMMKTMKLSVSIPNGLKLSVL
jgi:hypothetical protein